MAAVIELHDVSKWFRVRVGRGRATTLKSAIVDLVRRSQTGREEVFTALRGINLSLEPGRTLGVIGRNGSGKSTLLKVIAGIYRPNTGSVHVRGRVAALIELGAGFHPEFTGRENIIINGMLLGLSRREVLARLDEIARFADLDAFIDEPVRKYSSGMYMRLGFAVAVHLEPDVLLMDEVLAVGDEAFAKKSAERVAEFQRLGKTIVLVTHDAAAVERWCDEVVWLDRGVLRARGAPRRMIDLYHQAIAGRESEALAEAYGDVKEESGQRWGTREIEITSIHLRDANGRERYVYQTGEPATLALTYRAHRPVESVVFGFAILRRDGVRVYGTNTTLARVPVPDLGAKGEVEVTMESLDLVAGSYVFDVAVHAEDGSPYDYQSGMYPFSIRSDSSDVGIVQLHHRWRIKPE